MVPARAMPTVTALVCGASAVPRTTACGDDVTMRVGTSMRARGNSAASTDSASFS